MSGAVMNVYLNDRLGFGKVSRTLERLQPLL